MLCNRSPVAMPVSLESRLRTTLETRRKKNLLRELRAPSNDAIDFSSNDYLSLARPGPFQSFIRESGLGIGSGLSSGATGSRLLSGHSKRAGQLEKTAALFHGAESALLFNSGYDANISLLSCLPARDDCIVYDERVHASVHDGMRMGRAKENLIPFKHNDLISLRESVLEGCKKHGGNVLVCIETVYSMDGDIAPLKEMLKVAAVLSRVLDRDILIIADEAHAGGIFGPNGEGLAFVEGVNRHPNLLARTVTYGKAFAAHGAVLLGSAVLRRYLINYARPFIYSTALPPHSVAVLMCVYEFARTSDAKQARQTMWHLVEYFQRVTARLLQPDVLLPSNGLSPIQGIIVHGNRECVRLAQNLRVKGFDVYPIRSPTVPRGMERIRIIIHAHNTEEHIDDLVQTTARAHRLRGARL